MPPLVVDATVAGVASNSYVTLAEADIYHESHLYADTWDDASDDRKNRALVMATRLLDTWFDWVGEVATIAQALLWPRASVPRPNRTLVMPTGLWPWSSNANGLFEATDAIPDRIKQATCDWARALLESDRTADSDTETQGLKRLKAGPVELEFIAGNVEAKPIPDAVMVAATAYGTLRSRSGSGAVTLLRG